MHVHGGHALAALAIVLVGLSLRATESYTARYQTLAAMDWLESRPPLVESARVPPAPDLVRGLLTSAPLLTIHVDARPLVPVFQPPAMTQRSIGGVRDAASIELGLPGAAGQADQPVRVRMELIVFNRAQRAEAWAELMRRELDVRNPHTGFSQVRLSDSGADELWLDAPPRAGTTTVVGHRGSVGYELQVALARPGATRAEDALELSARSEALARQVGGDWAAWLEQRLVKDQGSG